jgi:Holliday junction DNA helicase RuvA
MALAILSGMSAKEFSRCVQKDEVTTLVKIPGVGKKTAERLLIEMRDKITKIVGESSEDIVEQVTQDINLEAESALTALGYKPQDAAKMVSRVAGEHITDAEQLIRAALKSMV